MPQAHSGGQTLVAGTRPDRKLSNNQVIDLSNSAATPTKFIHVSCERLMRVYTHQDRSAGHQWSRLHPDHANDGLNGRLEHHNGGCSSAVTGQTVVKLPQNALSLKRAIPTPSRFVTWSWALIKTGIRRWWFVWVTKLFEDDFDNWIGVRPVIRRHDGWWKKPIHPPWLLLLCLTGYRWKLWAVCERSIAVQLNWVFWLAVTICVIDS